MSRQAYVGLVFIYYTVLWCVKGAFIALYFDVFTRGELQKKYVVGLWALAAWTFAAYVTLVLYFSMLCTPIQRNWCALNYHGSFFQADFAPGTSSRSVASCGPTTRWTLAFLPTSSRTCLVRAPTTATHTMMPNTYTQSWPSHFSSSESYRCADGRSLGSHSCSAWGYSPSQWRRCGSSRYSCSSAST